MIFLCYSRCSTCQKAEKYLTEHGIEFDERDIKEQNPSAEELDRWMQASGLPSKKFFNTSGKIYKDLELSKKLPDMPEDERLQLLSSDGMLVKRPLLIDGDTVLVGFRQPEWDEHFGINQ